MDRLGDRSRGTVFPRVRGLQPDGLCVPGVAAVSDGNRLRTWRRDRLLLTQEEFAQKAGVSERTLLEIEKGRGNPHPETKRKILAALGLPLERYWEIFPCK